jgi:proteasome accessory factor A
MNTPIPTVPVLGADIELGNAWTGGTGRSNLEVAGRILRQLDRIHPLRGLGPDNSDWRRSAWGEWGRHWLPNGGCIYVDMSHVEVCPPETLSARDHAAAVHAMYRIVGLCRRRSKRTLPAGEDLFVNIHNSDGTLGTSWGAHQNVNISRRLWDALFNDRKPHLKALLASFVAATVPVFGQGMILPLRSGCRYVASARAHHLGSLVTLSTTEPYNRGLLNSRDEPHARADQARLHLIAYDANLQPAAIVLRSGLIQLVVAALESGWFDAALLLDDPVAAVQAWSWGFDPQAGVLRPSPADRPGGAPIGLFEWHRRLLDGLRSLVDSGQIPDPVVPEGSWLLDRWEETLDDLVRADLDRLARRLDWALKWTILAEPLAASGSLDDPQVRLLDLYYGHVDNRLGLFWSFWRQGLVDRLIDPAAIRGFLRAGDCRTRSGLRGELVRRLRPWIVDLDWSVITVSRDGSGSWWQPSRRKKIALPDPAEPSGPRIDALRRLVPDDDDDDKLPLLEHLIATAAAEERWPQTQTQTPIVLSLEHLDPEKPWSLSDDDHRTPPSHY